MATQDRRLPEAVSVQRHGTRAWRKPDGFCFARGLRCVPVTLAEAILAAAALPVVFQAGAGGVMPQVLLRLGLGGASPFIGQQGQWHAAWLPTRLQAYPFDLVAVPSGGQALALHWQADVTADSSGADWVFAQEQGDAPALSPSAAQMAALLQAHALALPATASASAAVQALGLLRPLQGDTALYVIDPEATAALSEAAVVSLHRAGALGLVHAALVSHAHLAWMAKAERHLAAAPQAKAPLPQRAQSGASFLSALMSAQPRDVEALFIPGLTPS